ncbi:Sugar tr and/or MFS 1 domain containing protein, partial [Asbolus verrucosus]
ETTALLHILSFTIHEAWTSIYLPELLNGTHTTQITSDEGSWITAFLFVGALLGSGIPLIITDRLGRKITIMMISVPNCISFVMLAFANSVIIFYVARLIAGIAGGMSNATILFHLGEIADPKIRGFLHTFYAIFVLGGFLFISVLGPCLSAKLSSLISAAIPIIHLLIFVWIPESPYYLIKKENFEKAKESLKKFTGDSNVEEEFVKLKEAIRKQSENKGRFLALFKNKFHRKTLLIAVVVTNMAQLSGTASINVYLQLIAEKISHFLPPNITIFTFHLTRLVTIGISLFLIDNVGRRTILLLSATGCAIALFLLGLYIRLDTFLDISNYAVVFFIFLEGYSIFSSFMMSVGPLMLSEIFPTNVKVFASTLYTMYLFIVIAITIKFLQMTSDYCGMDVAFFTYVILCLIHIFLVYILVPETLRKTLEEIQDNLES